MVGGDEALTNFATLKANVGRLRNRGCQTTLESRFVPQK